MTTDDAAAPYVLGDWGTSNLRLYLVKQDRVCAEREGPGIGRLTRAASDVLLELTADWTATDTSLEVILCGMGSSRSGLLELPYVKTPCHFFSWANSAKQLQVGALRITLCTGVMSEEANGGADVMRGEEAQIFGAMQIAPQLRIGDHRVVLPGTHSKWVALEHGSIRSFRTAITGELFALLASESTLLKVNREPKAADHDDAGFVAGRAEGLALRNSLLSALFRVRTAQLLQGRSPSWAASYLSGLLIGYEVASMGHHFSPGAQIFIIGQEQIARRYQDVLAAHGMRATVLDGAACARSGLSEMRAHAMGCAS